MIRADPAVLNTHPVIGISGYLVIGIAGTQLDGTDLFVFSTGSKTDIQFAQINNTVAENCCVAV